MPVDNKSQLRVKTLTTVTRWALPLPPLLEGRTLPIRRQCSFTPADNKSRAKP
jgi:hypothetical protein